jgi:hypothetical protein
MISACGSSQVRIRDTEGDVGVSGWLDFANTIDRDGKGIPVRNPIFIVRVSWMHWKLQVAACFAETR